MRVVCDGKQGRVRRGVRENAKNGGKQCGKKKTTKECVGKYMYKEGVVVKRQSGSALPGTSITKLEWLR